MNLGSLGAIERAEGEPPVIVDIEPDGQSGKLGKDGILEFTIRPGETIQATIVAHRMSMKERIVFGKEDSGRNLPHGVYVDNIGLNGLMIPAGKDRQRFFLTAAKGVPETERLFHLRTTGDDSQATVPVRLKVVSQDRGQVATR